jgi:hypothetical protein
MKIKAKMENIVEICNAYDGYFHNLRFRTLSDLLWQIIVNKSIGQGGQLTFYAEFNSCQYTGDGIELLIVEEDVEGYYPTGLKFDYDDLDKCQELSGEIREEVFGIGNRVHRSIISGSMFPNK